jgi:hypothetical protein
MTWMLLIVFLQWPFQSIVLERFVNEEECLDKRDQVGYDMAEAYQYERDFTIECQLQARVI